MSNVCQADQNASDAKKSEKWVLWHPGKIVPTERTECEEKRWRQFERERDEIMQFGAPFPSHWK